MTPFGQKRSQSRLTRTAPMFALLLLVVAASDAAGQTSDPIRVEVSAQTDALAPDDWSQSAQSLKLAAGLNLQPVRLFGQLQGTGIEHNRFAPGMAVFVPSGIDTTFRLERESAGPGTDSVDVVFPRYVPWDEGGTNPFDRTSRTSAFLSGDFALGMVDVLASFRTQRDQRVARSFEQLYNPQGWVVGQSLGRELRVSGTGTLLERAASRVTLRVEAARTEQTHRTGLPADIAAAPDGGPFGIEFGTLELLGEEMAEYDEEVARAIKYDALPWDELQIFPDRQDLMAQQSYPGIGQNLRLNPYGMSSVFDVYGFPLLDGLSVLNDQRERGYRLSATADWELDERNLLVAGIEGSRYDVDAARIPLFNGRGTMMRTSPSHVAAFVRDRLTVGQVRVEAGIRFDRVTPGGEHSRVPGFVSFTPDSLRRDFFVADPDGSGLIPLEELTGEPCNGAATCLDNFIEAESHSAISPHVGFSADLTERLWFGVSLSQRAHGPGIRYGSAPEASAMAWSGVLFRNALSDFATGMVNASSAFGRDVDLPSTQIIDVRGAYEVTPTMRLEAGIGRQRTYDALVWRVEEFESPVTGGDIYPFVLTNRDADAVDLFDLTVDWRVGALSELSFGWIARKIPDATFDPAVDVELSGLGPRPLLDPNDVTSAFGPGSSAAHDSRREHMLSARASIQTPLESGGLLSDVGVLATARAASGVPYTRLVNQAGGQIGPFGDLGGDIAEELNSSRTPWVTWLDLRVHKGVGVLGGRLRAFAAFSGALGENQSQVFLETGGDTNEDHRETVLALLMGDQNMDGDAGIDDFFIGDCHTTGDLCEFPDSGNPLNAWSLLRAEQRFGNGDGLFEVEEQREAFGAFYDAAFGPQWLSRSDRSLSFGLELLF